jgi:hypothetical protein
MDRNTVERVDMMGNGKENGYMRTRSGTEGKQMDKIVKGTQKFETY